MPLVKLQISQALLVNLNISQKCAKKQNKKQLPVENESKCPHLSHTRCGPLLERDLVMENNMVSSGGYVCT